MQKHRTVGGGPAPPSPHSTLLSPGVAQRSARRAAARRASSRRATARRRSANVEGRIIEYLKGHPRSTAGAVAKAVNANRDTIAAERAHMVRAGHAARVSRTIAAPPRGRFSRDEWVPSGPSGEYTFLYRD